MRLARRHAGWQGAEDPVLSLGRGGVWRADGEYLVSLHLGSCIQMCVRQSPCLVSIHLGSCALSFRRVFGSCHASM